MVTVYSLENMLLFIEAAITHEKSTSLYSDYFKVWMYMLVTYFLFSSSLNSLKFY